MIRPFVIFIAFGLFYLNSTDEIKREDQKDALGRTPIVNASYYWPFNNFTKENEKTARLKETKTKDTESYLQNAKKNTKVVSHEQLGNAIHLDGKKQYIEIKIKKGKAAEDFFRMKRDEGLSAGFWIKFISGDYILAAGGYARWRKKGDEESGFRIQRDKITNYHTLEVADGKQKWRIYIEPFPTSWVYLSFSWHKKNGLKLYINGELTFHVLRPTAILSQGIYRRVESDPLPLICIGKVDNKQEFQNYGNLQISHFSVWFRELKSDEFNEAYKAHIIIAKKLCCYHFKTASKTFCDTDINSRKDCLCPQYKKPDKKCNKSFTMGCEDKLPHCNTLIENQDYCNAKDILLPSGKDLLFSEQCQKSCGRGKCGALTSKRTGPLQHFSEQTLIFALLGCVGGLVILFGVTVYFWKVYRTRYQGTFIPQIKTVSLLDVSDYEDEKWPNKYIDSAAYYIKDVPPKKRPLPLLPAKMNQNNIYRYQPPEFD